jgi:4-hydroxy-tetrahydrodipicolinate synthase
LESIAVSKPFDLNRLATVQLVPVTPFSADGSRLAPESLESHVRWAYAAGIRVFLPAAGTGEFHSLTAAEVVACVRATRRAVGREGVVIAPLGMSLHHALAIGKGALEAGADLLLVMPPIHPYLSDEGLRDYFEVLMKELPIAFLAYKKGPYPSESLLVELGKTGKLVGVKYAVNDLNAFTRFAASVGDRLGLYCGSAERFAPFFHLAGAKGYTTGAGNLCPRLTLALQRALEESRFDEAIRLLAVIRPIEDYRARGDDSYNISFLKAALKVSGRDFGPPRPPQRRISDQEEMEIAKLIEPILAAERRIEKG